MIDTSALIAILEDEPERPVFAEAIANSSPRIASAVIIFETSLIMHARRGPGGVDDLWELLKLIDLEIVPFGESDAREALEAYARWGKGMHPKARLNLCDCISYALAKSRNAPLLFKGEDFRATDVKVCL